MRVGIVIRTMGEASRPDVVVACARAAEDAGLDDVWVVDHIAIPPDDAEGSGGRYLDPLTTLAHLAAATDRVGLGTAVLILPYRPPLPTAKAVATVQELSGGRLRLGVGVGWMKPEFRALGVDRSRRGALGDAVLDLLTRGFGADDDVVEENGQRFLFRPKPPRPPIYVGGAPPHAFERALRFGDGWMPMGADPDVLAPQIEQLRELAAERGRPAPEVVAMGGLPEDAADAGERLRTLARIGVTSFVSGGRYEDADGFTRRLDPLVAARNAAS